MMVSGESHQESCVVSCITIVSSDTLFPFTFQSVESHENSLQLSYTYLFCISIFRSLDDYYLFDISLLCILLMCRLRFCPLDTFISQ